MNNLIDTIPFIGVRGDVLIETRDAKSGKLVQRSEGHNLFTNYGLERFRASCAGLIGCQYGRNYYFDDIAGDGHLHALNTTTSSSLGLLRYLYLTDNDTALSADDLVPPGTVTGYASRIPYAGADALIGNVNINECLFSRTSLKAVFDFATDRANGTHKSVFFTDNLIATGNTAYRYEDTGINYSLARNYACFCEADDGYFYGTYGTTLYKINPTTLEEAATYTLPATPIYSAIFDVYNGKCYFCTASNSTTLYVFTLSDSSSTTMTLPAVSGTYGGAVIAGYLYYPYATTRVYKFDLSTGASEYKTLSAYAYSNGSIIRVGSQLYWVTNNSTYNIYTYDYDTNTLTELTGVQFAFDSVSNTYSLTGKFYAKTSTVSYYSGASSNAQYVLKKFRPEAAANMITGRVLDTPIEKNNTRTMKVTYTITFS